jgi:hypothetical protein
VSHAVHAGPSERRLWPFILLAWLLVAGIAVTHQLTPVLILFVAVTALVVGAVRNRWLVLGCVVIVGLFDGSRYTFLSHNFKLFTNAGALATPTSKLGGLPGQLVNAEVTKAIIFGMFAGGLVGLVRRAWLGRPVSFAACLYFAPLLVLGVQSYGGEAVLRVILFCAPVCCYLIADMFDPPPRRARRRHLPRGVATGVLLAAAAGSLLVPYFGREDEYQVTPAEVEAAQLLAERSGPDALVVMATEGFPALIGATYPDQGDTTLPGTPVVMNGAHASQVREAVRAIGVGHRRVMFVVSRGMVAYAHHFQVLPDGSLESLSAALAASPAWRVVVRTADAVVFELVDRT